MSSGSDTEQLNGWKEISAYIGKGVRQAQRWEKLGMPVHRVQGMDGVVYAYRSEIDLWRKASADGQQPTVSEAVVHTSLAPPASPVRAVRDDAPLPAVKPTRAIVLAVAAIAVCTIAIAFSFQTRPSRPAISSARLSDNHVEALDSSGSVVWRVPLGFPGIEAPDIARGPKFLRAPQHRVVDLDRDGSTEVLIVARTATGSPDLLIASDRILCFSQDGTLRWTFALPEIPYRFDGRRFGGPTRFTAWMLDREGNTWVAANHHEWWPTVLVRISPAGQSEIRYVQSGAIYALTSWRVHGEQYVVAGGVSNEDRLASVAVIDAEGSPAVSPQTPSAGFHCDACPRAAPVSFTLLPRPDISRASRHNPYSFVVALNPVAEGIRVTTYEGEDVVFYHVLTPDLAVTSQMPPDNFVQVHLALEREGRLDHSIDRCPDRRGVAPVHTWTPRLGWSSGFRGERPRRAVR